MVGSASAEEFEDGGGLTRPGGGVDTQGSTDNPSALGAAAASAASGGERSTRRNRRDGTTRRRNWRFAFPALILVVGLLAGTFWWLLAPTEFTAETRVSVGDQSLANIQVPAYATATQTIASNYARYVADTPDIVEALSVPASDVSNIRATPIPESSVIRLIVTASSSGVAVQAANDLSHLLIQRVADAGPDIDEQRSTFQQAYRAYQDANDATARANTRVDDLLAGGGAESALVDTAINEAREAQANLATLDLEQQALGANFRDTYADQSAAPKLVVLRAATQASSNSLSSLQRALVVGVLAAGAVGVAARLGHSWRGVAGRASLGESFRAVRGGSAR